MGFVPNLNINAKKIALFSFLESAMHAQDHACVHIIMAAHVGCFLRAHSEDFLGFTFPKIDLFPHLRVIFSILTFLKSI